MNKTRSLRRHHQWQIKQKRYYDCLLINYRENGWFDKRAWGIHANTPTVCSCWMCGNPRKYYRNSKNALTIQELRHLQTIIEYQHQNYQDEYYQIGA